MANLPSSFRSRSEIEMQNVYFSFAAEGKAGMKNRNENLIAELINQKMISFIHRCEGSAELHLQY